MKILDFWAPWCQPCKQMEPVIDELSQGFDVERINIDDNMERGQQYSVMSIPTLIILDGEKEIKRFTGVTNIGDIKKSMVS